MNDFPTQLTALLDDVASSIDPTPDFDAVLATAVPVVSTGDGGRRFRGALGAAAACVALLGGGVAAYQVAGDDTSAVVTSSELTEHELAEIAAAEIAADERAAGSGAAGRDGGDHDREPAAVPVARDDEVGSDERPVEHETDHARTAELGDTKIDGATILQVIHGRAAPGEFVSANSDHGTAVVAADDEAVWEMVLELTGVPEGASVPIRVTFGRSDAVYELVVGRPIVEEPKPEEPEVEEPKAEEPEVEEPGVEEPEVEEPKADEPKHEEPKHEEPEPIPFTVQLAGSYNDATHMKQVFHGTAPASAVVYARSDWGSTHVTAGRKGGWELHFVLEGVPDDTVVRVVLSANTGGVFEFDLVREKPAPEPEPKPFTVQLGDGFLGNDPMKQVLYGTGAPGSGVLAATEFGSEDARVDENGHWEMVLKMYEVPAGTTVGVRVTNNQSESVYEFSLQRPAEEPDPVEFTANAVYEECGSEPPYNEYWGTSAAGSTISITSPYGNGTVTANGDGHWEARVEFPSAPIGETFIVEVTSSAGGETYEFPLTRTS